MNLSLKPTRNRDAGFTEVSQSVVQKTESSLTGGSTGPTEWRTSLSTPTGNLLRVADPVRFEGTVQFAELPEQPIDEVEVGELTPSVLNITRLHFSNTTKTVITNFLYGQEGQEIILLGEGHTEVANNANIVNHSSSDVKLTAGAAHKWCFMLGKWRQVL